MIQCKHCVHLCKTQGKTKCDKEQPKSLVYLEKLLKAAHGVDKIPIQEKLDYIYYGKR